MRAREKTPTRERLLQAAIKVFARRGFEGASTRLLTKEAKANISAIPYYFKDKGGLYRAVMEHIASLVQTDLAAQAARARQALDQPDLSTQEARELLHGMIRHFIRFLLSEKISGPLARIFLREQMEPTTSFDIFYETTMRPMHELLTRIVARTAGLPFPSENATLCAHALLGQISVFKTHREAALRRLRWEGYGDAEIEKVTETVIRHADFIVDSYRRERSAP